MRKRIVFFLLLALLLTGCMQTPPEATPAATTQSPQNETLSIHFIDVGQADCALLECGGKYMLIDGGNVEDSDLVVAYLREQGISTLDYVVNTHAHEKGCGFR